LVANWEVRSDVRKGNRRAVEGRSGWGFWKTLTSQTVQMVYKASKHLSGRKQKSSRQLKQDGKRPLSRLRRDEKCSGAGCAGVINASGLKKSTRSKGFEGKGDGEKKSHIYCR
jgi:hypothetical protein